MLPAPDGGSLPDFEFFGVRVPGLHLVAVAGATVFMGWRGFVLGALIVAWRSGAFEGAGGPGGPPAAPPEHAGAGGAGAMGSMGGMFGGAGTGGPQQTGGPPGAPGSGQQGGSGSSKVFAGRSYKLSRD